MNLPHPVAPNSTPAVAAILGLTLGHPNEAAGTDKILGTHHDNLEGGLLKYFLVVLSMLTDIVRAG